MTSHKHRPRYRYGMDEIATAAGVSVHTARRDARLGAFSPRDFKSVLEYIRGRTMNGIAVTIVFEDESLERDLTELAKVQTAGDVTELVRLMVLRELRPAQFTRIIEENRRERDGAAKG